MKVNKLIFKDAELARNAITEKQKKEIAKLYEEWADDIGDRAKFYRNKTTSSSWVSERQMKELQKQLKQQSRQISNEIYKKIKNNIYIISDAVVSANEKWLNSMGIYSKGMNTAFSSIPDMTVNNLITGQIYKTGWSLSSRIWGDNEKTLKDIYQIVAKGMAENKPIYDIAKNLEMYVRPNAKLSWNLVAKDGVKIYKKSVDYNAQRLARTLVQHGYQQSFIATTQKNPFIESYTWISNGSRVCPLCESRDGEIFEKDDLPMDHPNGMCTMVPNIVDNLTDKIADWVNNPDGTYPEIDEFAKEFGYEPSRPKFGPYQNKYLKPYGYSINNMPAKFNDWFDKANYSDLDEIVNSINTTWDDLDVFSKIKDFYNQNIINLSSKQIAKPKVKKTKSVFNAQEWNKAIKDNDVDEMDEWCTKWLKKLNQSEIEGVRMYTGNAYRNMNRYLRGQTSSIDFYYEENMKNCISALEKASLPKDVVVRRGSDFNMLEGLGFDVTEENKSKIIGALVKEEGFTSTSPLSWGGFDSDIEYVIKVPKGSQAMYVDSISKNRGEKELLINRGAKYQIEDVEFESGKVKKIYMILKNLK